MNARHLVATAVAVATAIGTVAGTTTAASATSAPIPGPGTVRLAGADRYATAVAVSRKTFTAPQSTVVVASGEDWPDALAAGPLAAMLDAPILLVTRKGVPTVVDAELKRLGAVHVVVVVGKGAVPDAVLRASARWSNDVRRIAGADRYATAAAVAADMGGVDSVYLSSGTGFADALGGGAAAAAENGALVLTSPSTLSGAAAETLRRNAPSHVVILGGTGAVSSAVERQVKDLVPSATVDRAAGRDRYETAFLLAAALWGSEASITAFYASGTSFADALAGTSAAYVNDAPVLLTRATCTPAPTEWVEQEAGITTKVFLGGAAVTYAGSRSC